MKKKNINDHVEHLEQRLDDMESQHMELLLRQARLEARLDMMMADMRENQL